MRRALAPRGRLAVATWRPDNETAVFQELHGIAERHLGPFIDRRHAYGEAAPLETLLREAGFHDVRVRTVSRSVHFVDVSRFPRMNTMALAGMSDAVKELEPPRRQAIVEAIISESMPAFQAYNNGTAIAFEVRTNLATAQG